MKKAATELTFGKKRYKVRIRLGTAEEWEARTGRSLLGLVSNPDENILQRFSVRDMTLLLVLALADGGELTEDEARELLEKKVEEEGVTEALFGPVTDLLGAFIAGLGGLQALAGDSGSSDTSGSGKESGNPT